MNSTIATLIVVITRLTREESLVPRTSSMASATTSTSAPQSKVSPPASNEVCTPSPKM